MWGKNFVWENTFGDIVTLIFVKQLLLKLALLLTGAGNCMVAAAPLQAGAVPPPPEFQKEP